MKKVIFTVLFLVAAKTMTANAAESYDVHKLSEAIFLAEGGASAKKPYGILSVKCSGKEQCGKICRNTIRNNLKRWEKSGKKQPYLEFLARRYAPIEAENDPTGLNKNWLGNVEKIYRRM